MSKETKYEHVYGSKQALQLQGVRTLQTIFPEICPPDGNFGKTLNEENVTNFLQDFDRNGKIGLDTGHSILETFGKASSSPEEQLTCISFNLLILTSELRDILEKNWDQRLLGLGATMLPASHDSQYQAVKPERSFEFTVSDDESIQLHVHEKITTIRSTNDPDKHLSIPPIAIHTVFTADRNNVLHLTRFEANSEGNALLTGKWQPPMKPSTQNGNPCSTLSSFRSPWFRL